MGYSIMEYYNLLWSITLLFPTPTLLIICQLQGLVLMTSSRFVCNIARLLCIELSALALAVCPCYSSHVKVSGPSISLKTARYNACHGPGTQAHSHVHEMPAAKLSHFVKGLRGVLQLRGALDMPAIYTSNGPTLKTVMARTWHSNSPSSERH